MSQTQRLSIVLGLNVVLVIGLAAAGLLIGSLSLLAAAGDSFADAFALGLGLMAVQLRDRRGSTRATNVVALVNVVLLLGVTLAVWIEAIGRLLGGAPEVPGAPLVVAAVLTAVVLGLGVLVLGAGAGREDLHMRSVLLDTAADGLAAAAVALAGIVIAIDPRLAWLDPLAAALIGVVVAAGAVRLLVDVVVALRTGEPLDVDPD